MFIFAVLLLLLCFMKYIVLHSVKPRHPADSDSGVLEFQAYVIYPPIVNSFKINDTLSIEYLLVLYTPNIF